MNNKFTPIITLVSIIILALSIVFLLGRYQLNVIADITSLLTQNPLRTLDSSAELPIKNQVLEKEFDQSQEITQLRQEVEELKKQYSQESKKVALKPAASPIPDLKTQEQLNRAKEQINSLTQQLVQLLTEKTQSASTPTDSDLLKTWQADSRVVRIACQDRVLNTWQMGSGVLISADGKLLTNQHVVLSSLTGLSPEYCLALFNKDFDAQSGTYQIQYRATVVGFFQDRDAAMLKITDSFYIDKAGTTHISTPNETFSFWPLAIDAPQIADTVYVVGFPESASFTFSVTKGIISNITPDGLYYGTDAQIDRGNSGGAAVNSAGQLIGLPTWKYVGGGDYRGYILNIQTISLN